MSQDNTDKSASEGGAGAPPEPHEANQAPPDLTRVYTKAGLRVEWFASRCIHSAACIRSQPAVFDPRRRPWIDIDAAGEDEIARAVLECPTGALQYELLDGSSIESPQHEVTIVAVRDGPYFVRGPIEIKDADGNVVRKDSRMALCRCGQSKHMPFCDNTHRAIGFRSDAS
jgi:uncharacterized Fe-S cluster protein YjdI